MAKLKLDRVPSQRAVRQVPIVVNAEGASEVSITGDFTEWSEEGIALRRSGNGEFRTVLQLEPGEYQYRLLIDGEWKDDPRAPRRVANPSGTENCILEVPPVRG